MKYVRRTMSVVCLLFALVLAASLCLADDNVYTTVPSTSVTQNGENTNEQPATWTTSGHVRRQHNESPPEQNPMQIYMISFTAHDFTVCNFNGTETHKAAIRIGINSGAGVPGDGVKVKLYYDQRTFIDATLDQKSSVLNESFEQLFDANDINYDLQWNGGPEDRTLSIGQQMRYAVGSWQGEQNYYQTTVVTQPL
jgi:hypothetical protein